MSRISVFAPSDSAKIEPVRDAVLVLGSGPIRIGQGIEFDYSAVHCVWALEKLGFRALIINNNPETVSTDFDTGDGLYFEPVTVKDVLRVVEHERPIGVVCQFGGQTAINLAQGLADAGVSVLGTTPKSIARAEDREQFEALLEQLDVPRPKGFAVHSVSHAIQAAQTIGYPVLVRPSFVLGGRAMAICYDEDELTAYYAEAEDANPGQPVLVDRYILGVEAEVDVISDGTDTLVPGIMEHIERAGVHSGDSMAVYPPVGLSPEIQRQIVRYACRIAKALDVRGLMNIQFVVAPDDAGVEQAFVLEVNPRASRTVPYLSKVTQVPMVELATRCMMGEKLADLGYTSGLWVLSLDGSTHVVPLSEFEAGTPQPPNPPFFAVKAPVFSFQKLSLVEPSLGPEMKSTGEIMGIDHDYAAALYKALVASGIQFKGDGEIILSVQDRDKAEAIAIAQALHARGYRLAATGGTHDALREAGIPSRWVMKIHEGSPSLLDHILSGGASMMINTPSADKKMEAEAARIRRACIETGIACITSLDTAQAIVKALDVFADPSKSSCKRLETYFSASSPASIGR